MVCAAWLHDVIEDCGVSEQELRKEFGDTIADYVVCLTNPSKGLKLSRSERKNIDREHLKDACKQVKIIKLIDRIDNIRDFRDYCEDKDFNKMHAHESALLLNYIGDADEILSQELKEIIDKMVCIE